MPEVLNRLVPEPRRPTANPSPVTLRRLAQTYTSNRQLTCQIVAHILGIEARTLERELNRGRKLIPNYVLQIWKRQGLEQVESS